MSLGLQFRKTPCNIASMADRPNPAAGLLNIGLDTTQDSISSCNTNYPKPRIKKQKKSLNQLFG